MAIDSIDAVIWAYYKLTTTIFPLAYTTLSLLALSFVETPRSVTGLEGKRADGLTDMRWMLGETRAA